MLNNSKLSKSSTGYATQYTETFAHTWTWAGGPNSWAGWAKMFRRNGRGCWGLLGDWGWGRGAVLVTGASKTSKVLVSTEMTHTDESTRESALKHQRLTSWSVKASILFIVSTWKAQHADLQLWESAMRWVESVAPRLSSVSVPGSVGSGPLERMMWKRVRAGIAERTFLFNFMCITFWFIHKSGTFVWSYLKQNGF